MSRKREQARQARINNRLAAGTYTAPQATQRKQSAEFQALIESAHDTTRGKPAVVRVHEGISTLYGGAKGAGKVIAKSVDTPAGKKLMCLKAVNMGYHIVGRKWLS